MHLLQRGLLTDIACTGDQSKGEAFRERAAQLLQLAEDRSQSRADCSLREPEMMREAALTDGAIPDSEHPNNNPGASCTAAADALAEQQKQQQRVERPAENHSTRAHINAGPALGSVVWAREKGWPYWPALLITKETSRGLCNLREFLCCLE